MSNDSNIAISCILAGAAPVISACIELIFHLLTLPLSALNLYIMATTSILHLNLKLLLSFQSVCVLIYAISRVGETFVSFWLNHPFWHGSFTLLMGYYFGVAAIAYFGHFLLTERIIATLAV